MDDGQVRVLAMVLAALVVVLVGAVAFLLVRHGRDRRRTAVELAAVRAECAELRQARDRTRTAGGDLVEGYVITDLGREAPVPDRVVLSAVVGEPLVKLAALAHGVRRGLAPETRARIAFTVRREVKRSRKVRRREMRAAWRQSRADARAGARADARSGARSQQDAA